MSEFTKRRREYFEKQLMTAVRRLKWSIKHKPDDDDDHIEKENVVQFYNWAVAMAIAEERGVSDG